MKQCGLTFWRDPIFVWASWQTAVMGVKPRYMASSITPRGRTFAFFLFCSWGIYNLQQMCHVNDVFQISKWTKVHLMKSVTLENVLKEHWKKIHLLLLKHFYFLLPYHRPSDHNRPQTWMVMNSEFPSSKPHHFCQASAIGCKLALIWYCFGTIYLIYCSLWIIVGGIQSPDESGPSSSSKLFKDSMQMNSFFNSILKWTTLVSQICYGISELT